jgi:hypothetical protein
MSPNELFDPKAVVRRIDEQVHCALEGSVVVMTLADGKYFELNPIAARIWDELAEPIAISELIDRLLRDYDVDADTCQREVNAWLGEMRTLGLLDESAA